jgi:hypothetical protein
MTLLRYKSDICETNKFAYGRIIAMGAIRSLPVVSISFGSLKTQSIDLG